jgi:hypothetical protein
MEDEKKDVARAAKRVRVLIRSILERDNIICV